jgi:hypothetical protein
MRSWPTAGMPAEMSLTVVGREAVRDQLSRSAERVWDAWIPGGAVLVQGVRTSFELELTPRYNLLNVTVIMCQLSSLSGSQRFLVVVEKTLQIRFDNWPPNERT